MRITSTICRRYERIPTDVSEVERKTGWNEHIKFVDTSDICRYNAVDGSWCALRVKGKFAVDGYEL